MNGGGGSSSSDDTVMRDVMEGYDSTSDEEFEIILGPPRPACVSCARCRRLFHYHAEFLNHIEACLARERMIKEQKGKGQCYQFHAPHDDQRGGAGPSSAAPPMRALNLFNDPLELRLAPPGPPPPPPSLSLELTLAIGRNRPGGFRQQPGNNNNNNRGIGPGAGNAGKNFKK